MNELTKSCDPSDASYRNDRSRIPFLHRLDRQLHEEQRRLEVHLHSPPAILIEVRVDERAPDANCGIRDDYVGLPKLFFRFLERSGELSRVCRVDWKNEHISMVFGPDFFGYFVKLRLRAREDGDVSSSMCKGEGDGLSDATSCQSRF